MSIELVFETHSWSEDNDRGLASGWRPGKLSRRGRLLAAELGQRRRADNIDAVFTSDLARAIETVEVAFAGTDIPVLHDWRLRECDFGSLNGTPARDMQASRRAHVDVPFPQGESWRQAIYRVGRFLDDLPLRWDTKRILVVGHVATKCAFDHFVLGMPVEELIDTDFEWRFGWEYHIP